jgi:hypothetical protein
VPDRTDLYFGYFGDCDGCIAETSGHANLAFVMGWPGGDAALRHASEAVAAGQKIVLAVDWQRPDVMRWQFAMLQASGALSSVVALYPQDEPDQAGLTADQVGALCAQVRAVASEYPELAGVALAAIYGPGSAGIEHWNWVGRDNYGTGPIVPIRQPRQRVMLVPGGADPWRENPAAFLDVANRTPAVVAIVPFLWRWPDGRPGGIATNGMAAAYRAAGMRIRH